MIIKLSNLFKWALFLSIFLFSCSSDRYLLAPLGKNQKKEDHKASGRDYMVTSPGKYASQAGLKMFALGGNIADAATAVSFTLAVERPQSTGIGGGGFLLHRNAKNKKIMAYDFREKAPLKATRGMYLDETGNIKRNLSIDGPLAVGVPGLVAGILSFHREHGSLSLKEVLGPAIELAEKGFKIYPELDFALSYREKILRRYPSSKKIFFVNGKRLREGEKLVQKDLGKTLRLIEKKGTNGFYRGEIAKMITKESRKYGGILSLKDLKTYNVKRRRPIKGDYKGYQIYSMPPPSSGGIHIIQILNILESFDLFAKGAHSPEAIHLVSSAMQQAFADRAKHLGDSDFVNVPLRELADKGYAKEIAHEIKKMKARPKDKVYPRKVMIAGPDHTTHFTIMDGLGNIVSSTQTINGLFGSGFVVAGTGIVLNNEMDDFTTKIGGANIYGAIGGEQNIIAPEKRPLSSMSPTIVTNGQGDIVLTLGTPNGTRILTCVAQTILNYLEYKMPLYESVMSLRYHHQWHPDRIWIENGLPVSTTERLKEMGHRLKEGGINCKIQAIAKKGKELIGVSDARGRGVAVGK